MEAYLDEGSPSPLHGSYQEAIPPQGPASFIVSIRLARANPYCGYGDDDGNKDDEQVQEAEAGGQRLDYIVVEKKVDASSVLDRVLQRRRDLLVQLLSRRLEHCLFVRLVAITGRAIGHLYKCERTQQRAARRAGRRARP